MDVSQLEDRVDLAGAAPAVSYKQNKSDGCTFFMLLIVDTGRPET